MSSPHHELGLRTPQRVSKLGIRRLEGEREAHSLYLGVAAETGVLGIACFLAMLGVTMHGLLRARARWAVQRSELASMAAAYFAALVVYVAEVHPARPQEQR